MRRGILGVIAIGCRALALWKLWNPGYYYLGRAALFSLAGAAAVYLWLGGRQGRLALASSCLYLALILIIAAAAEWIHRSFRSSRVSLPTHYWHGDHLDCGTLTSVKQPLSSEDALVHPPGIGTSRSGL